MHNPDNNMDELFRNAAENYPLKTDMPDWDDIAPALLSTPAATSSSIKGSIKLTGLFLLVGILLAGSALFLHFYNTTTKDDTALISSVTTKDLNKINNLSPLQNKKINAAVVSVIQKPASPVQKVYTNKKVNASAGGASSKQKDGNPVSDKLMLRAVTNSYPETIAEMGGVNQQIEIYSSSKKVVLSNSDTDTTKSIIISTDKDNVKDTAQKISIQSAQNKKKNTREHGVYVGLFAGTQLSQVKGQGFKKPGLNIGVLAGYRFNHNISLEGGLIYSKKKYYSDGKYFDPQKTGTVMPAGIKVVSLFGESSVIEIPIKIKYDFLINKQSGWFVTGGFSSTVLLNENNAYTTLLFGSPQNMYANYHKKRGYFISAFNFSTGHEFKAFNKSSIRVEPYVQIPVKGIGVGVMPVFTTGLHIGITIPGFK